MLTSDPWTRARPDPARREHADSQRGEGGVRASAGVGPDDLDLVELHDCFATAELLHYENLGLCEEGEAGRMIDEGETIEWGGRIPVNVERRPAVEGPPAGRHRRREHLRGVAHLRGQAGARQVEGAKVGMAHVIGLGSACTINILQR